MKWTNDTCLKLIDEYRRHPELWNKRHPFYCHRPKKRAAWELISQRLGCQVEEVRRKMEILQVGLRRERSKVRKRAASQPKYEPRWFAYQKMKFLLRSRGLAEASIAKVGEDNKKDHSDEVIQETNENVFPETTNETSISNEVKVEEIELPLDWPIKLESIQTNLQNPLTNEVVNDDDDDECSVFGKYLVKKLRGYDRKVKCIVQYNINKMLFQADMGCYNDGRYSSNELSELANIQ